MATFDINDVTPVAPQAGPGRGGQIQSKTTRIPPPESLLHRTGREVIGNLPALGATVGAGLGTPADVISGPVGTVAGAAVGAGLGEAARQTLLNWFPSMGQSPQSTQDALAETGKQMLLGGATEAAGPYIDNFFKMSVPALRASAKKGLLAVMNPTDRYAKGHALEAAEQLLEGPAKNYIAGTRKQLQNRAESKISEVGAKIGEKEAESAQNPIDSRLIGELNQSLADYKQSFYMPRTEQLPTARLKYGYEPNLKALENIEENLRAEFPGISAEGRESSEISRESLRLVRQNVDNAVRKSEGFAREALVRSGAVEPALASKIEVERDAGDIFRKILNKDRPDIAKLNAEYHLWTNVRDAMSPATLNKEFSKESSHWQQLWHDRYVTWLAGAGATAGAGHYLGRGAAEATGALFAINQLIQSTAWKTVSAATKNQLADMLAKGQLEGVAKLATRVAVQRSVGTLPPPKAQPKTVKMRAPDGSTTQDVPADQVEHYKSLGASVIQ